MSKGRKILYWIITGIILSIAVSSMIQTRDGSLKQFYDDGYVKNLKEEWLTSVFSLGQFEEKQRMHLNSWESTPSVFWERDKEIVHYLLIDTEYWNGANAEWIIFYQNETGAILYENHYEFQQGELKIPILKLGYSRVFITLRTEENLIYKIDQMKLSEYKELLDKSKWLVGIAVSFLLYLLVSLLIMFAIQKRANKWRVRREKKERKYFIEKQADILLGHINCSGSRTSYASKVRIFFIILFVVNGRIVHYFYERGYAVAVALALLLAMAAWLPLRDAEEKDRHVVWQVWLLLCGLQFISNIFLRKEFGYGEFIEVWMLLGFGLLYRAWGRMKRPQQFIDDIFRAVEILTAMISLFCIFGDSRRNYIGRLSGTRGNQNPFALGIAVCFVFMLFRLYQVMRQKKKWYYYLEPCCGLGLCYWMISEAETRNAWAIAVIAFLIFLFFVGNYLLRGVSKKVKSMILGIVSVAFLAGVFLLIKNGWVFSNRVFVTTSMNMLLSGRPEIWKVYLEKVNILGCIENLVFGVSGEVSAHNGIIMTMYRYGVLAGIVKIIFLIEVICAIHRIWKRNPKSEYSFLLIGTFIAYFISSMLDTCDEGIIGWIGWTVFYMMVGYIIQENRLELRDHDGS